MRGPPAVTADFWVGLGVMSVIWALVIFGLWSAWR